MAAVTYRVATPADAETLAHLRWQNMTERHPELKAAASYDHFVATYVAETRGELERGSHVAWLAEADGQVVACVLLVIWVVPPAPQALRRRRGFVSSVYTQPPYRRQGISRALMDLLLAHARAVGVGRLVLWASEMGEPLYGSLGFTRSNAMQIEL